MPCAARSHWRSIQVSVANDTMALLSGVFTATETLNLDESVRNHEDRD